MWRRQRPRWRLAAHRADAPDLHAAGGARVLRAAAADESKGPSHRLGGCRHRRIVVALVERPVEWLGANRTVVTELHQDTQKPLDVDHTRRCRKFATTVDLLVHANALGGIVQVTGNDLSVLQRPKIGNRFVRRVPVPTVEHKADIIVADCAISPFVSAIVWMKLWRLDAHNVLVAMYSSPSRRPWSPRITAQARTRVV